MSEKFPLVALGELICERPKYGANSPSVEYLDSLPRYLRITDILNSRRLDESKRASIKRDEASEYFLHDGDFLFARSGNTVGKTFLYDISKHPSPMAFAGYLIRFRLNEDRMLPGFLDQFCQSASYLSWVESCLRKGAQPNINASEYLGLLVPTPPIAVQKKIIEILSIWDDSIDATQLALENSKKRKKALMQQLLTGKKRLPGFTNEWKLYYLDDFFERLTTRNSGLNTNVVTISGQRGFVNQRDYFSKQIASDNLEGYFIIKKGDFAYNKSYSSGYPMGAIKRLKDLDTAVVTTLYICFSIRHDRANSDFFEHYFESGLLNRGLRQICQEGARDHGLLNVKPSDFFKLVLNAPDLEEQRAIADIINLSQTAIDAIESRLNTLTLEKKALMQQLLTGKKRVNIESIPA